MSNKPAHIIRNGRLKVTIWRNTNNDGEPFYTATLIKSYKDKDSDQWKETNQVTGNEISTAATMLVEASEKVSELEADEQLAA